MDYFQSIVTEYLRAKRCVFVNTEYLVNLDAGDKQYKGRHWYCDVLAVNFEESTLYLCEVTYSSTMQGLISRLKAWDTHWQLLAPALIRDACVPDHWSVQPWIFIPKEQHRSFDEKFALNGTMPTPRVTHLEEILPWKYPSWDRKSDAVAGGA